jgi:hypothetical protein
MAAGYPHEPRALEPGGSGDTPPSSFIELRDQYRQSWDRDKFVRRARYTQEYVAFLCATILNSNNQGAQTPDNYFEEIDQWLERWKGQVASNAFYDQEPYWNRLVTMIREVRSRFLRAQMVADILIEVCWQLTCRGRGLFPIPVRRSNCDKERLKISKSSVAETRLPAVPVEFSQAIFYHAGLASLFDENTNYIVHNSSQSSSDARNSGFQEFGWKPDFLPWKWRSPVQVTEGKILVEKWPKSGERLLFSYASFRDFFENHSSQIVAAYVRDRDLPEGRESYECLLEEKGKKPGSSVLPDFQSAKWQYQMGYACSRQISAAAVGFLTLSFSIPVGRLPIGSASDSGIPSYAIYLTLDLLSDFPKRKKLLRKMQKYLHANVNDLRIIATQQLASEALEVEARLRHEAQAYQRGYERLTNELNTLTRSLSRAADSVWRVTSIVGSHASYLYGRASTLGELFREGAEIRYGEPEFVLRIPHSVHTIPSDDEALLLNWCAAIVFKIFVGEFERDSPTSTKLWKAVATRLSQEDDFTSHIRQLFFPNLSEFPTSLPLDTTARDEVEEACLRLKLVLHKPFKPAAAEDQELSAFALVSAFPSKTWSEKTRSKIAELSASDGGIFKGVPILGRWGDLMSFLADLWFFAAGERNTKYVELNWSPSEVDIEFMVPGPVPLFRFNHDELGSLLEVVANSVDGHRRDGYVGRGNFAMAFFDLFNTTLQPKVRELSLDKVEEFRRNGALLVERTKIVVNNACLRIESAWGASALSISFEENRCIIKFDNGNYLARQTKPGGQTQIEATPPPPHIG